MEDRFNRKRVRGKMQEIEQKERTKAEAKYLDDGRRYRRRFFPVTKVVAEADPDPIG